MLIFLRLQGLLIILVASVVLAFTSRQNRILRLRAPYLLHYIPTSIVEPDLDERINLVRRHLSLWLSTYGADTIAIGYMQTIEAFASSRTKGALLQLCAFRVHAMRSVCRDNRAGGRG